jgi:hypothetical protein
MLLFRNSHLLSSLYVLLRCHKQWHTLGNDTLFLRRSNVAGRNRFFRRGTVQSGAWLCRADRLVTGPYVTSECSICAAWCSISTARKLSPRHYCSQFLSFMYSLLTFILEIRIVDPLGTRAYVNYLDILFLLLRFSICTLTLYFECYVDFFSNITALNSVLVLLYN